MTERKGHMLAKGTAHAWAPRWEPQPASEVRCVQLKHLQVYHTSVGHTQVGLHGCQAGANCKAYCHFAIFSQQNMADFLLYITCKSQHQ